MKNVGETRTVIKAIMLVMNSLILRMDSPNNVNETEALRDGEPQMLATC